MIKIFYLYRNHVKECRKNFEFVKKRMFDALFADNIILMSDSYKASHWRQYPANTEYIYSYFESRGGLFDSTVFFGLQYIVNRYLAGKVVTSEKIAQAAEFYATHLGSSDYFNRAGWEYILEKHGGYLPVSIKGVPEGSVVSTHNVLLTVVNTDPACYWLPNFLETLLVQVWYPCTVATSSREQKKLIKFWLEQTGGGDLDFKLHDFGFRGVSSLETSAIGGLAHLINFKGTDTVSACLLGSQFYDEPMAGFSIPASEHSTITSWGQEGEIDAYRNMLHQYPNGTIACVSDSWNIFGACRSWSTELKSLVLARDGRLVIRPDSGDPVEVILKVLDILGAGFDSITTTSTGHKLLPSQVRVIQGDAVDLAAIGRIYSAMASAGWAADNVGFGSGGALLQKLNRDTQKFAFKCSAAVIDGVERDVWKNPVTDPGKRSKKGGLALVRDALGNWATVPQSEAVDDQLVEMFRDGNVLIEYKFGDIRKRAEI